MPEDSTPDSGNGPEERTERSQARREEDEAYTPVIIKRSDEFRRHPDDVLQHAIDEGLEQLNRAEVSLVLSAVAAGLILGFTAMSVGVVTTLLHEVDSVLLSRLLTAGTYPLGFIVCLMVGSELFTEHTATAVYPVLDRRARPVLLLKLLVLVLAGNLAGAVGSAGLLTLVDPVVQARQGYLEIGQHLVGTGPWLLGLSAIFAGWLMALGAWLIVATPPAGAQIACIYIVTFLIGLGGFHHSIAGAVEVFTALFVGDAITLGQALRFLAIAILGNFIGGSLFVAVLNYAHIRKTREVE